MGVSPPRSSALGVPSSTRVGSDRNAAKVRDPTARWVGCTERRTPSFYYGEQTLGTQLQDAALSHDAFLVVEHTHVPQTDVRETSQDSPRDVCSVGWNSTAKSLELWYLRAPGLGSGYHDGVLCMCSTMLLQKNPTQALFHVPSDLATQFNITPTPARPEHPRPVIWRRPCRSAPA